MRGDDPLKVMRRAGHSSFETTQKYIRTAEAIGGAIGEVFPTFAAPQSHGETHGKCLSVENEWRRRESTMKAHFEEASA